MTHEDLSRERQSGIAQAKRAAWTQTGAAEEYQYLAYKADPLLHFKNIAEIDFVLRNASGDFLLDAGAGTGRIATPLRRNGRAVVALDISREMLGQARKTVEKTEAPFPCTIGDVARLPFPDATFDGVVSVTVVRHYPDWPHLIEEYLRVVKSGGRVVFDMGSGEQRRFLADRLEAGDRRPGPVSAPFGGNELRPTDDPLAFDAAPTCREVENTVRNLGGSILTAGPGDILCANPLLDGILGPNREAFDTELRELCPNPQVVECYALFARRFLAVLSPALSPNAFFVIEKRVRAAFVPPWHVAREPENCGSDFPIGPNATGPIGKSDRLWAPLRTILGRRFETFRREFDRRLEHPKARQFWALFDPVLLSDTWMRASCFDSQEGLMGD